MARTTRRTRLALGVGVVVLLAVVGAAVVLATGGSNNPLGTGQAQNGQLAPGVYQNETVNVTRLLQAHRTQLREQGFRTQTAVTSRQNGTVVISSGQQVRATSNLSRVMVEQNRSAPGRQNVSASIYANETKTLVRLMVDGNESFQSRQRTRSQTVPPISRATLTVLGEAAGNFSIENVNETDDGRRVAIAATLNASGGTSSTQTQLVMVVDEQGVIHSMDIVSGQRGAGQSIQTTYRLEQLGVSTVEEPAWVSEVPPNASQTPMAGGRGTAAR